MNLNNKNDIESFWEERESLNFSDVNIKKKILDVLELLDSGQIRVCEKKNGIWTTNEWIKKSILLSFKCLENNIFSSGISNARRGQYSWYDKAFLKTSGWVEDEWTKRNFRSVPGAIVRYSAIEGCYEIFHFLINSCISKSHLSQITFKISKHKIK